MNRPDGTGLLYATNALCIGLATTSTGNDDVALEVENAANANLIHGDSA